MPKMRSSKKKKRKGERGKFPVKIKEGNWRSCLAVGGGEKKRGGPVNTLRETTISEKGGKRGALAEYLWWNEDRGREGFYQKGEGGG